MCQLMISDKGHRIICTVSYTFTSRDVYDEDFSNDFYQKHNQDLSQKNISKEIV